VKPQIQFMLRTVFTGVCGMVDDMAKPCVC
jgi:hypothetical protein